MSRPVTHTQESPIQRVRTRFRPRLDRLRNGCLDARIRYLTWRTCGRHYAAPISPTGLLALEPSAITHALTQPWHETLTADSPTHVQSITGGDWDREATPFTMHPVFRAHREHAVGGVPWPETMLGDAVAPSGAATRAAASASPLERVATDGGTDLGDSLETCYADVAARGYRSVRERRRSRGRLETPTVFDPYPRLPPAKGEIRVCLGRDGRVVLQRGHHRLAIARLLDVERVPVHVSVRHPQWQARRDRVVLTGSGTGDHPDLEDLEPRRTVSR